MKIVSVVDSLSTLAGGMQVTVAQFTNELNRLGHEVVLIGGKDSGAVDYFGEVEKISLTRVGTLKYSLLLDLERTLDELSPDVIIQHGIWSLFCTQITRYSRKHKIPYVVVPHGMLDPYILRKRKLIKMIALKLYQNRNLRESIFIRALNLNEKKHIESVYKDASVVVTPNGLKWSDTLHEVVRDSNTVLFLGRLDEKKSVCELIEAWSILQSQGRCPAAARLRIVGWGDKKYEAKIKLMIQDVPSVEFVGPKFGAEKELEFKRAGAFILPSKGEGLPTAVLEAWSSGAIVIMTPECNFDDDAFLGRALLTGSSPISISIALKSYFDLSIKDAENIRDSAFGYVEKYSWKNIINKFSDALISKLS